MFDKYFLMKTKDVMIYAKHKLKMFSDSELECDEIGDGNLNYVFRVVDKNSKKSIIVKQGSGEARISSDIKISVDRNRIESEILELQNAFAPDFVPKVYEYDPIMSCIIMEDLSKYEIMRNALLRHKIFPKFSDQISTFLVRTLLLSSDVCMDHKNKKELVKKYINPELCEITENLVYTEPYNNCANRNNVFNVNKEFVEKELYNDKKLHIEIGKLKISFMTNAQSLLHGDLHTGSIFINEEEIKIIDPEFGFYGPMGYDIGNVIANLIFSWNNANAEINDVEAKKKYIEWIEISIKQTIDLFKEKFLVLYKEKITDTLINTEEFMKYYLKSIINETAGITGLELIRRTVGLANVRDITSIKNLEKRKNAEKINILVAKEYIYNSQKIENGEDFIKILKTVSTDLL